MCGGCGSFGEKAGEGRVGSGIPRVVRINWEKLRKILQHFIMFRNTNGTKRKEPQWKRWEVGGSDPPVPPPPPIVESPKGYENWLKIGLRNWVVRETRHTIAM